MKPYIKFLAFLCFIFSSINTIAQRPRFSNYHRALFTGHPAPVLIKGNSLAELYKTIITKTYKAIGLNFGGHYCLVWWGCGSDCQHAAIVDLKTGIVYDGPTAANLFEYKSWSSLLIVNRPEYEGDTTCAFCKPEYWVWNERSKRFRRIK